MVSYNQPDREQPRRKPEGTQVAGLVSGARHTAPQLAKFLAELLFKEGADARQIYKQTGLGSAPVTFMDAFADRIRRTAIRDNIPPDQVLKLMLHGRMSLAQLEQGGQAGGSAIG